MQQRGLLLGSCFAENIGMRMKRYKLPVVFNPFGILFNPASVGPDADPSRFGEALRSERPDPKRRPVGQFRSSRFAGFGRPGRSVENDQSGRTVRRPALREAGYLILTLGTAWVYQLRETGEIVCNCHKRPSGEFLRRRLSVDEVVGGFVPLLEGPLKDKPVIWTVSPVRHLGDGLPENALSKSTLIVAIHRLIERYPAVLLFSGFRNHDGRPEGLSFL